MTDPIKPPTTDPNGQHDGIDGQHDGPITGVEGQHDGPITGVEGQHDVPAPGVEGQHDGIEAQTDSVPAGSVDS